MRLFILMMSLFASSAQALTWDEVWKNQDQQAYQALTQNNFKEAATLFKSPEWQGIAYYRMGDYQKAVNSFMKGKDATAWYNRGNALAHLGQYSEAIQSYDQALALNTHFEDARFNKALLQQLFNTQTTATAPSPSAPQKKYPPFKRRYENKKNENSSQTSSSPQNNTTPQSPDNTTPSNASPQGNTSQAPNTPFSSGTSTPNNTNPNNTHSNSSNTYQNQQQQQSLQNMSDDPGGLLQRKLARDYAQSQQQGD